MTIVTKHSIGEDKSRDLTCSNQRREKQQSVCVYLHFLTFPIPISSSHQLRVLTVSGCVLWEHFNIQDWRKVWLLEMMKQFTKRRSEAARATNIDERYESSRD